MHNVHTWFVHRLTKIIGFRKKASKAVPVLRKMSEFNQTDQFSWLTIGSLFIFAMLSFKETLKTTS